MLTKNFGQKKARPKSRFFNIICILKNSYSTVTDFAKLRG